MSEIMQKGILFLAAAIGAVGLAVPPAHADVLLTATQVGSDVVISGGGTLDLTGLTFVNTASDPARIYPITSFIAMGPVSSTADDIYSALVGPFRFGLGLNISNPTTGSGDVFGINEGFSLVAVPHGYTSGSALFATDTYANQTFATLGMTPGTYVYTLQSYDTFTLQIGPAVPTPAAFSAGLTLLGGLGISRRRRELGRRKLAIR